LCEIGGTYVVACSVTVEHHSLLMYPHQKNYCRLLWMADDDVLGFELDHTEKYVELSINP